MARMLGPYGADSSDWLEEHADELSYGWHKWEAERQATSYRDNEDDEDLSDVASDYAPYVAPWMGAGEFLPEPKEMASSFLEYRKGKPEVSGVALAQEYLAWRAKKVAL